MAFKHMRNILIGSNHMRSIEKRLMLPRLACYHSTGEESDDTEEEIYTPEWYDKAFIKMKKWSHSLKEMDLIGGKLVNVDDYSRVFDDKLEQKMLTFKSIAMILIGLPLVQETMRNNMRSDFPCFSRRNERESLSVNSLTKVTDILSISAQQRKVVRFKICPQVTQHRIWTGALEEVLNGLKFRIDVLIHQRPSKEIRLALQIVIGCLKFLESSISYDPECTSWMRLTPTKGDSPPASSKWEDVLEMSSDLINCLSYEKEIDLLVSKLEGMKEGLYQIRDLLIDKNIGYKENRFKEHLVQKKLSKNLGHSSRCLFTLLLYYLYNNVRDIEIDVRGGVHIVGGGKSCLYIGKILTSDEEKVVWNSVKELDRSLGLFKFVWEAAGKKGDLELQGHMWYVGADSRSISYRGNMYFLHGIDL